jgi:hypothetical protein
MTLRMSADLALLIDAAAAADGLSRHQFIIDTLWNIIQRDDDLDPALAVGFITLIGGGEMDDADCPECARPFSERGGPAIGFLVGTRRPLAFGPVCAMCAHTE